MTGHERASVARETEKKQGAGTYFFLFGLQTVGMAMVFFKGVPIYRQLARDFAGHQPQPSILWWAAAAVGLIQAAYWARMRLQVSPSLVRQVLAGHLVSFAARLTFILASSTFGVMFLVRFDQLSLSPQRILMLLLLLFSVFCYTLELERLAKAFQGAEIKT